MSKEQASAGTVRTVDVVTVRPGQIEKMARSGAVPTAKFRAAIDRAAARQR